LAIRQLKFDDMSSLSTLPKGDSAWLLRKAIERIIDQVSVLETNIGVSTSGNSANTQIIFNDDGTLRGDAGLVYNKTTDALTVAGLVTAGSATITGDLTAARLIVTGGTIPTNGLWLATTNTLEFAANSLAQYRIAPLGVFTWFDGAGGTRMTLNSTGLGVGVTPAVRLDLLVADAAEATRFRAASGWLRIHPYLNATDYCRVQAVNGTNSALIPISVEGLTVRLNCNFGNAVTIDSLGNTISNVNSAIPSLGTNSQMVFNLTSNTNLRISVRGSDGTTRVANLTLA
jgi:hypothetical protein